ncbi:MAG TPA: hypothetical protein VN495_01265 [Candidatus Paceibacterota bacterium]|nr:hypothetical protein [Candidatus Paceibacterota bacterium]
MEPLEERVANIEARNKSVEADKAWETSGTRKLLIVCFTYATVSIFLTLIGVTRPWLSALVPVVGFFLSTLTVPFVKKHWIRKRLGK